MKFYAKLPDRKFSGNALSRVLVAGFGLFFALSATAQVYQWKDADGKSILSDVPPPGVKAKQISKTPSAEPEKVAKPGTDGAKRNGNENKADPEKEKTDKAAAEKQQSALNEYCESATRNLTQLESGRRISSVNAKGEPYIMDDTQRAAEAAKVRRSMLENKCP